MLDKKLSEISSGALAYLGDCVLELRVREFLVSCGISHAADLNRAALDFVRAAAQSDAVEKIYGMLDEEEQAAFRRGRNIGHTNTPKSATALQYRRATGMEALSATCTCAAKMSESTSFLPSLTPKPSKNIKKYKRKDK